MADRKGSLRLMILSLLVVVMSDFILARAEGPSMNASSVFVAVRHTSAIWKEKVFGSAGSFTFWAADCF